MSETSTDKDASRRVGEEADIMRPTREDQVRFANALIDPPKANARHARAAQTHARLIAPR